jgi:ATP-dependent DNA helicase RecG
LARQHHASLSALLQPLQIEVGLLLGQGRTSAQKSDASQQNQAEPPPTHRSRKATLAAMADGTLSLVVGTHALLSDTAIFKDLGMAVIDEQHRFGVRQRILLGEKGRNVDVMVMTATPIPRSLAMTVYGDLDHSQLDEKPVGRLPIHTRVIAGERLDDIVDGLRRALGDGKRAYWICPLVDESDQLDISAAEDRFTSLSHALPGISVALAHGKMKAAERDSAMQDFRTGRAQLLVATTVVEVGVDVPEASIIVIEHAERFGLAQLHQLRGRVGRSSTQSSCLLVYYRPLSETASNRLSVMRETNDGFVIAEEDLNLRGPGEFLGQRQSGVPEFVLADLAVHRDLLAMARTEAHTLLAASASSHINLLLCLFERDSAVKFLAAG